MILRLIKVFLISLLLLAFSNPVLAVWQKNVNNPLVKSITNSPSRSMISAPSIINDDGKLRMWYYGEYQSKYVIGEAESNDGINWTINNNNPLLLPESTANIDEKIIVEPAVVKNDLYRMWYNSGNNQGNYWIRYATSNDGIYWQKHPDYVIKGEYPFEAKGVTNPFVIFENGRYQMWYSGWGNGISWSINYAESIDGINWVKNSTPLDLPSLGHVNGPSVIKIDNKYHLFYHTGGSIPTHIYHVISDDGINNWQCVDNCLVLNADSNGFDSQMAAAPEIISFKNKLYLYYGGSDGNGQWQIGLAQPEQTEKKEVNIIIPGLFGSWNKQALLHNQTVNQIDWNINPIVNEYTGLKNTLNNIGFIENQNYYFFYYDWRKGLNDLADNLKDFISGKDFSQETQVNILGHSLGGLVGRIYAQKYQPEFLSKIVTVGSPHQGTALAYKTAQAGELETNNSLMWLGQKLVLQLNKSKLITDKKIVENKLPIVNNLLPVNNYLIRNNAELNNDRLKIKNTILPSYIDIDNISDRLITFSGNIGDTLFGYRVGPRTFFDQIFDFYPDGRPISKIVQPGDLTVTLPSSKIGNQSQTFNFDHGELIYKSDSIKVILDELGISYNDNEIIEGKKTVIFPSLIFLMMSPAKMEIISNNKIFEENDGIIFIENATSGNYQIKITGTEKGEYQVIIGQLTQDKDIWSKISGDISEDHPENQVISYYYNFDFLHPQSAPYDPNNLTPFYNEMEFLTKKIDNRKALIVLSDAKKYYREKQFAKLKLKLLLLHNEIFKVKKPIDNNKYAEILGIIDKLELLYWRSIIGDKTKIEKKLLAKELSLLEKLLDKTNSFILKYKDKAEIKNRLWIANEIAQKIRSAKDNLDIGNYSYSGILLKSIAEILKDFPKIANN